MQKNLLFLIIISCFSFISCSYDVENESKEENQNKITTSYIDIVDNSKKFILSDKTFYDNKYIYLGNLLFFPDIYNNNKLSISNLPTESILLDTTLITDNFDFNINSLTTDEKYIFFSSLSTERGIYKLDYEKNKVTKINNDYSKNLIYDNEKLYYINSNDNKLYYYNISDSKTYLLSNSLINSFAFNNNCIFYINSNDDYKLYCLKTDGNANFNITDTSVESFVIYDNEIIFSNSTDNNYLYSLNIETLETNKILNLSATNLKQNEDNIYFINSASSNSLFKLLPSTESSNYGYIEIFSDYINEYYPKDNGIFIEAANNSEKIIFININ